MNDDKRIIVANALLKLAREICATDEAKAPDRTEPDSHPSRSDLKKRYKKRDIRKEDKPDYEDTTFDRDLEKD